MKTPHSGYHRRVGVERPFFEGWYFRVTLPRERQSASLIYHVYDPDLPSSRRHGAGAQVCAPGRKVFIRREPERGEWILGVGARVGIGVDARRRRILRGGERGRETSRMAHERGRGRDRAVERWMRGEIGALGHHRDARARMGRWRRREDGFAGGMDDGASGVRAALAGHHGARFGEWVDRNGRRSRGV